ncbi:response regulator transcription factor [Romboutsia sp.]|uniref:response regulator transcription factor n=1 Tax=Romboutsia sp. TaxID=1965302 RepID=UPI003F3F7067
MKIFIVAKSFIIKEALEIFFKDKFKYEDIKLYSYVRQIQESIKDNCLVFIEIDKNDIESLDTIFNIKANNIGVKIIALDSTFNRELFTKCVKGNIDGYITNLEDKSEFEYIVSLILSGKKFYDSNIAQETIIDKMHTKSEELTKREIEVMNEVVNGLNNKDIAKKLYITEYTVKKHISSIFNKLNLKSRQDIIIYVKDKERSKI